MKTESFLSSRNIGLDLLRAGLILEGVLLHASRSLPGENGWYYVAQRDPSEIFTALLSMVHTFRMEVFFFLSGMFSALIILRKGQKFFTDNRRKRVLIPLISAFVELIPVTARFLVYYTAGFALYVNREKIARYANSKLMNSWLVAALVLAVWAGCYVVAHNHITGVMKYVPVMLGSVLSVMLSYWLVFSFERINVKESRILTAIVDSALIIYLLHYPVVIIFSWLLDVWLPDNLSVLYVLIDFALGIALSAVCYAIVKRSRFASFMFGLKPKDKKVAVPVEARL